MKGGWRGRTERASGREGRAVSGCASPSGVLGRYNVFDSGLEVELQVLRLEDSFEQVEYHYLANEKKLIN